MSAPERAPLTRQRVLAAALRIVDEDGPDALTMRRLGAALGVEAMSLYHHVPDKAAILDGIAEAVFADVHLPPARAGREDWADELCEVATALYDALLRHPGALPVVVSREVGTPAAYDVSERISAILFGAGFPVESIVYEGNALGLYVIGAATARVAFLRRSSTADAALRAQLGALAAERYPTITRLNEVGDPAAFDWDEAFRRGLRVLVEGLRASLERAGQPKTSR